MAIIIIYPSITLDLSSPTFENPNLMNSLPFTCNFGTNVNNFDDCNFKQDESDHFDWSRIENTTTTPNTGPPPEVSPLDVKHGMYTKEYQFMYVRYVYVVHSIYSFKVRFSAWKHGVTSLVRERALSLLSFQAKHLVLFAVSHCKSVQWVNILASFQSWTSLDLNYITKCAVSLVYFHHLFYFTFPVFRLYFFDIFPQFSNFSVILFSIHSSVSFRFSVFLKFVSFLNTEY